jgi:hypothetical protein
LRSSKVQWGLACRRLASDELMRAGQATVGRPLSLVAGDNALSQAATFYSPDHPDSAPDVWQTPPWITDARRTHEGRAVVCFAYDGNCTDAAKQNTAGRAGVVRFE